MFKELGTKQLSERLKYLVEKMEKLYKDLQPKMNEYENIKDEVTMVVNELNDRETKNVG